MESKGKNWLDFSRFKDIHLSLGYKSHHDSLLHGMNMKMKMKGTEIKNKKTDEIKTTNGVLGCFQVGMYFYVLIFK